ncbi:UNVERIFIED_CONTAM: hypothetical protein PYX00_002791 [Menopon gallinae]|uniref:Uncharacterized protein n=1 Tax=Menopon gallinae TaxID=328185 RepID=A0AAW2HY31_9NEOP
MKRRSGRDPAPPVTRDRGHGIIPGPATPNVNIGSGARGDTLRIRIRSYMERMTNEQWKTLYTGADHFEEC